MKLPILKIRMVPDGRCIMCAQSGYVQEKARLCPSCLNYALLEYVKWKKAQE